MPIVVKCENCRGKFSAPDAMQGRNAKCPKCGNAITIPALPTSTGNLTFERSKPPSLPSSAPEETFDSSEFADAVAAAVADREPIEADLDPHYDPPPVQTRPVVVHSAPPDDPFPRGNFEADGSAWRAAVAEAEAATAVAAIPAQPAVAPAPPQQTIDDRNEGPDDLQLTIDRVPSRFPTLRMIAGICQIIGFLWLAVAGVMLILFVVAILAKDAPIGAFLLASWALSCALFSIPWLAASELIYVALAMEENTRLSSEHARLASARLATITRGIQRMSPQ